MSNTTYRSRGIPTDAGSRFRRLTPTGRASEIAAVATKLVPEVGSQRFGNGYTTQTRRREKALNIPDTALLNRISQMTANDVNDAQTIFQMLPETELAMQILVSSILAPKDLVTTGVNFTLDTNRFSSELSGAMLSVLTDHFESIYKISDLLEPSLQDALFLTGAYPLLILPETSIDKAINAPGRVSLEAMREDFNEKQELRNLGFLGNVSANGKSGDSVKINFGLESIASIANYNAAVGTFTTPFDGKTLSLESLVTVVDNPNILKLTRLQERVTHDRTMHLLNQRSMTGLRSASSKISQESYSSATVGVGFGTDNRRNFASQHRPIEIMQTAQDLARPTVGHPLVMRLPSEAVVPVHQPSNPEKHLGYFILLDELGNPLNTVDERDYYRDMGSNLNANSSAASQLLNQARQQFEGRSTDRQSEINEMSRIYGQFLEKQLTDRMANGIYGNQVEITAPEEIYRVMFARALAQRQTKLLFIPSEMMTYIAFDYNKYGIGRSLLQQSKILGGLRVMNLFAETMASIKNSINRTNVDITLDPEDPDPSHTVEFLMTEYAKTRQGGFPIGIVNPTDIITQLQNAATDVTVQGNTRFPEVKFNVTERTSNRARPDDTTTKDLRDRWIMALGLTPDMIDAGANAEFATSVLANNLLLTKRVLSYQRRFEGFLQDFVIKYILADGYLMDELRELVDEHHSKLTKEQQQAAVLSDKVTAEKKLLVAGQQKVATESIHERLENLEDMKVDSIIMEFLQLVLVSLPKPDLATTKTQMDAFDQQEQAYEKVLGTLLNTSFMESQGLGSLSDLVDPTKEAVKAHLLRKWLRENNVTPEVTDLISANEEDRPDVSAQLNDHMDIMSETLMKVMFDFAKRRKKDDPALERLKTLVEGGDGMGGGSDWDDTPSDTSSTDDGFGGDDLGAGLDTSAAEVDLSFDSGSSTTETTDSADAPAEDAGAEPLAE